MKKDDLTPKNARSEADIFAELSSLCLAPGYVHALAYFCFRDNLIMYAGDMVTEEDVQHQYSHEKLLRAEISTLIGLMVKSDIDVTLPNQKTLQDYVERSEYLLHEMHMCLQKPWLAGFLSMASSTQAEKLDPFGTAEGLREPIFYGGESAYNFQYEELAGLKYRGDNEWLMSNAGFSVDEAIQVARALGDLQLRKILAHRDALRKLPPDLWSIFPAFLFHCDELHSETGIDPSRIKKIVDAFCLSKEAANSSFSSMSAFNEINAAPIIRLSTGHYLLLQHYSLLEALYESPFFWMVNDKPYRSQASKNRGAFLESFLTERLKRVFGARHVYQNVDVYKGKDRLGEVDVLVLYGNTAIVVQAKSKRLTIEARKGNDLQLKSDFKNAIQDAYDQAWLCSNAILADGHKFVLATGEEINLTKKPTSVFPICVVADHYPAIAAQARQFLKAQSSEEIRPPIVTDVFFVDVLSEILESPLHLLNYLALRTRFADKLLVTQELTILGYHLKHNLWVEDQYNLMNLGDDFTSSLDIAMTARRMGVPGVSTPEGIFTRFKGLLIGDLLDQIEDAATPELVGLGMLLLQMGSDSAKHINARIASLVQLADKDGKHHDLSVPSEPTNSGFTVHVNSLFDDVARERLSVHCKLRKYDTKSDSWYGLLLYPGSGEIRGALAIEEKWKPDANIEKALVEWPRKPMTPINLLSRKPREQKIGRNDQCPCGSGKKYKKCCLNAH
ncbi:prepilin peptidase [Mesorhizobium sp. NBSH29]|uniref:nuclease-related domain-containing protein n=1 Tax=Mesorhizobium sp. NBSH29 TaxID=2654249 RepID=UPI0018969D57|nr:SEC-C metal-binding domain-containing protein [Mesorhizobium sp. NBSH29]QPC87804.1 prepilin peptidase [Mesorhizobium sp. NBSH29]